MSKKICFSLFLVLFTANSVYAQERLIFALDLIRHGDRTPITEIPKSPHSWKEGLGELTAEGMNQEFLLGNELRKKYIEKTHLLPANYEPSTIYVRSTDTNRTLMSAESLLIGLYPPGTGPSLRNNQSHALPAAYQPIPVHTLPKDQDTLLMNQYPVATAAKTVSFESLENKFPGLKQKANNWSQITGLPITTPLQLILLGDNLYIRKLNNISLPTGLSQESANEIMSISRFIFLNDFRQAENTHPMGKAFLKSAVNYLKQASSQKDNLKYVLFSGHDITIMSALNALGVSCKDIPKYASDLNFSLYQDGQEFYVKVSLNNQSIVIPGCRNDICTLAQFEKIVSDKEVKS